MALTSRNPRGKDLFVWRDYRGHGAGHSPDETRDVFIVPSPESGLGIRERERVFIDDLLV